MRLFQGARLSHAYFYSHKMNGDGSIYPFVVVPSNDGTNHTAQPHNLPALTSVAVIDHLQMPISNRFLQGYDENVPPGHGAVTECRRLVKIAIGCRAL
ncbi:hypothetical protein PILCRDRAFT_8812 [Piloderma croceum F 1598]|uniref:Mug135-like C-terminal domain-containing protein n=1 Tax=Piloderma croceum (strain F 1598) TaxID=765440 RepID=A0A0C3BVQ6_PILCF|nr:hypothetical protein PILCRDRAFT_8812 [Piloderma croceum F 1598]